MHHSDDLTMEAGGLMVSLGAAITSAVTASCRTASDQGVRRNAAVEAGRAAATGAVAGELAEEVRMLRRRAADAEADVEWLREELRRTEQCLGTVTRERDLLCAFVSEQCRLGRISL